MVKIYCGSSNSKTPEEYRKFARYNSKSNRTYIVRTFDARHSLKSCFSETTKQQALKSAKVFGRNCAYVTVWSYKK